MSNQDYVKICPKCGSTRISFTSASQLGVPRDFCEDCEYGKLDRALFPEIKKDDVKKFQEELKKNE